MSTIASPHPLPRISSSRVAFMITLGTETVFFTTVLVAYAALRGQVSWDMPHTLDRLAIPLINSSILLASALMVWFSTHAIRQGKQSALRSGLLAALLLGLLFIAGQVYEFNHAGLQINDEAFGGVFFTLIGFHAVHVLAGVFFLALNLVRAYLGDFSPARYEAVELGSWFWYYVTAVWVVLFTALYVI